MTPRLTITNLSPLPRRAQTIATVPQAVVADVFGPECTFVSDAGHKWRAVRCADRGISHAVFRIVCVMDGSQSVDGALANTPHPDANHDYAWHPWVNDDPWALVPYFGVARDPAGQVIDWSQPIGNVLQLIESSPLHQRWMMTMREPVGGFTFVWFADVMDNDPAIRIWGIPIWSNRNDPQPYRSFPGLLLKSGEYVALDFATRLGIGTPVRDAQSQWRVLLGANITMKDGAGLPLSGHMLTLPSLPNKHIDTGDTSDRDAMDLSSLKAAVDGPIVAVSHDWGGNWLAHHNLPRFADSFNVRAHGDLAYQQFANLLNVPSNFFAQRPLGIGLRPGATGDQEDFAATKGTYAVVGHDPRHIHAYNYSVMLDALRGFMHYESDGATPLRLDLHPNWVSWAEITHFAHSVSPDRLGKSDAFSNPTGVDGYDEEHKSQNNLAAYYAISDDPRVPFMLNHQLTTNLAGYRVKFPNNGGGAARAYGREMQAYANFAASADSVMLPKILKLLDSRWFLAQGQNNAQFRDGLAFPVLGSHGPDGRKPIFADDGTTLIPTASIWEHALALVGIYGAVKAGAPWATAASAVTNANVLSKLARLIAEWGCFLADDGWWFCADIAYFNGAAPTFALSKNTLGPKMTWERGGTSSWTLAAMLIAVEVLPTADPLRQKAQDCCDFFTQRQEATSLFNGEWWAAVRSVTQ